MGLIIKLLSVLKKIYKKYQNRVGKNIIHVESPHYETEFLIRYCKKHKPKCYCITPINYDFVNTEYAPNLTRDKYAQFLKKTYLKMKEAGADLQPHVHVSLIPSLVPRKRKELLINNAFNFFKKELGIIPKEIIFGWFAYDKEMEIICKKLNLKIVKWSPYIYDRWCKDLL